jgi:hypothetical protein
MTETTWRDRYHASLLAAEMALIDAGEAEQQAELLALIGEAEAEALPVVDAEQPIEAIDAELQAAVLALFDAETRQVPRPSRP